MDEPMFKLERTAPFPERHMWFGYGGVGKTIAVGTIAAYQPDAMFHVLDTDVSAAYQRLIWTEVPFTEAQWNIANPMEWPEVEPFLDSVLKDGNPLRDWLVIDNNTWTWIEVQAWLVEQITGSNVADHLIELRRESKDRDAFMKAQGNTMNWDLINKEYQRKLVSKLHKWKGNLIVVHEAEETAKKDAGDRDLSAYASYGVKPKGQKGMHYVCRTNLLFERGDKKDTYKVRTIKDQRAAGADKMNGYVSAPDDGGFAMDYLAGVAGWRAVRR